METPEAAKDLQEKHEEAAASQKAKAEALRKYKKELEREANRSFSHPNRHEHKRIK